MSLSRGSRKAPSSSPLEDGAAVDHAVVGSLSLHLGEMDPDHGRAKPSGRAGVPPRRSEPESITGPVNEISDSASYR
jgi:hypothetical protein